jgi:hypothetical protein
MIEPAHDLTITKQAKALNISRGGVFHRRARQQRYCDQHGR